MIRSRIAGFLLLALWFSCSRSATVQSSNVYRIRGVEIFAHDLTEDGNMFASGNDEVAFFMIEGQSIFYAKVYTFDQACSQVTWQVTNASFITDDLTMVLIEMDEDRSLKQLRKIVSRHTEDILKDYTSYDYPRIEAYLGDDDILYAGKLEAEQPTIEIQSSHKGDQFHYTIELLPAR